MVEDRSYGIIPLSRIASIWHVLLVNHRTGGWWGFPKGHAEPGEEPLTTARRELKEETNQEVVQFLSLTPIEESYQFDCNGITIHKSVYYFPAVVTGDLHWQETELYEARWVPLTEASSLITYDTSRALLKGVTLLD